MEQPKIVLEARPMALRFAREINMAAKSKWDRSAEMAIMVASLALQTLVLATIIKLFKPGSLNGVEFLDRFYDGARRDAIEHWNAQDLKDHFDKPKA